MTSLLRTVMLWAGVWGGIETLAGAAQPAASWERHAFALPESIWSVEAFDTDENGRKELIAVGVTQVYAVTPADGRHAVLFDSREGKMLYAVALDADQDGDADLAIGRYQVPWIEFRRAQAQGKTAPQPIGPDFSVGWIENPGKSGGPWALHVIDRELNGIHGLAVGDVDRDGRPDLIADSISGPFSRTAWRGFARRRRAPPVSNAASSPGPGRTDGRTTLSLAMSTATAAATCCSAIPAPARSRGGNAARPELASGRSI